MPEQDHGVLDARIRELVACVVDDAPAAPDLDGAMALETRIPQRPDHRARWIGGGAAVLAAAAAIVTAVVLVDDTDDRVSTPATTPTVAPTVVTTVAPTVGPTTAPPATVAETAPPTTAPPAVDTGAGSVVTAGAEGVAVLAGGVEVYRNPTPATLALLAPDGSLLVERPQENGGPVVINPDGSVSDELFPSLAEGQTYRLHDIAVIGQVPTILLGVRDPTGGETVYVASFGDSLGTRELHRFDGSNGPSRLNLADTGTVVGTVWDAAGTSLWTAVVPGSPDDDPAERPGSMLDAAVLGVPATCPADITRCPGTFTISSDGALVAWVERSELVTHDVATGAEARWSVPSLEGSAPLNGLDVRRLPDDVIEAAVSSELGDAGEGSPDELFRIGPDGSSEQTLYPGVTLTLSPYAVAPTGEAPTPPPAPTGLHVTAAPTGVAVWDGRDLVRQLSQPAELAVLLPGGSVVVQPPSVDPQSGPSELLVWRPDGTIERFLPTLPAGQSYRLHDAAEIAGLPTVLYGISTRDIDIDEAQPGQTVDPSLYTEVLHALRLDPAGWVDVEIDTVSTWEGGWSRLSLSDQGQIVGEAYESVTNALYVNVVPGSPADGTTITAGQLGVEPEYSECEGCPRIYAISQDGTTMAWALGNELIVRGLGADDVSLRFQVPALTEPTFPSSLDVRATPSGEGAVIVNLSADDPADRRSVRAILDPSGTVVEQPTDAPFTSFGP